MSEEKAHGTGTEGELKNSDAPNKFATSVGYLLTRSNPERAVGEAIDQLISERVHWENNELASSNETLYALLQHCYSLNNAMSGSDFTAKALRKGMSNYIQQKAISSRSQVHSSPRSSSASLVLIVAVSTHTAPPCELPLPKELQS
jgi:hypothetical protein